MEAGILRLLDANCNRAREGLRVLEDYARFVLDDAGLCRRLKDIRHTLTCTTDRLQRQAIHHRDIRGDVGTQIKTDAELTRADIADVVTAAGKRAGEALRAIQESLKVLYPPSAQQVESARYALYEVERLVAMTLGPRGLDSVKLYVLVTESVCRLPWLAAADAALRGGADCLQLREKSLDGGELLRRACALVELCRRYNALCIINDRPDIALLSNADGVHVGQTDVPAREVRRLIGPRMVLGVSTHHIEQAHAALRDGADYIGVGPVYPSSTKPREFVAGLDYVRAASALPVHTTAIAGITLQNAQAVLLAGARSLAVTHAVMASDDPQRATQEFVTLLAEAPTGDDQRA